MLNEAPGPEAARLRAVIWLSRQDYDRARQELMVAGSPASVTTFLSNIAIAHATSGAPTPALATFDLARNFAPLSVEALRQYGISAAELRQVEEGIALLREAVRSNPRDAESHYVLGGLLWQARPGNLEAVAELEQAIQLRDYFVYRYHLSGMYVQLGRLDDAEGHARALLLQPNGLADAYARLGDIAERRGQGTAAARCYRLAIQAAPDRRDLAAALDRARTAEAGGDESASGC
jgi:tetratricopeptide (TPR) repeat protein